MLERASRDTVAKESISLIECSARMRFTAKADKG